jgi:RNA polymerase sigma factor (TIGR02999 family)
MRQVLVDAHRRRRAAKRGGDWRKVTLDEAARAGGHGEEVDFLELEEAMERLAALDERQGRVVELRFFGGLTMDEIAHVLGVSKTTIEGDWRMARAWLTNALRG